VFSYFAVSNDAQCSYVAKKKKENVASKKKPPKPAPPVVAPTINDYRAKPSAAEEADFMATLMDDMDAVPQPTAHPSRKRKPSPRPTYDRSSSPGYRNGGDHFDTSSDGIDTWTSDLTDDIPSSPMKKPKLEKGDSFAFESIAKLTMESNARKPITVKQEEVDVKMEEIPAEDNFDDIDVDAFFEDIDMDEELKQELKEEIKNPTVLPTPATDEPKKASFDNPAWLEAYDTQNVVKEETVDGPIGSGSASVSTSDIKALEPDGSLRFYWLDCLEYSGVLYFIGKLKDKKSGVWVSCCVTVENLERNLFVLPREKKMDYDEDGEPFETDEEPSFQEVYSDFDKLRKKVGIKGFKAKFVDRKYAFGEPGIPSETRWMKVVYSFDGMCSF
jgi:DNA polymerase alpha subunit A